MTFINQLKRITMALLCGAFLCNASFGQNEEEAVKKTIMTMFDGMRAADTAMVHSVFSDEAVLKTIGRNRQTGEQMVRDSPLEGFLKALGTPHDDVWDEKVKSFEIKIDGPMATAWVPYEFYAGERFSHCGVNHFTLFKEKEGWKVIYLIDTRRRGEEACK